MICYWDSMDSPLGTIYLAAKEDALVYCANGGEDEEELKIWIKKHLGDYKLERGENPILKRAKSQLEEYFSGQRKDFDIPLDLVGTDFRRKVWKALETIPYGEARSYGDIARQIGRPKGPRAVGQANHHNPISYIVP